MMMLGFTVTTSVFSPTSVAYSPEMGGRLHLQRDSLTQLGCQSSSSDWEEGGERKDMVQVREAISWAEQLWLTKAKVLLSFIRKEHQEKKRKKEKPSDLWSQ